MTSPVRCAIRLAGATLLVTGTASIARAQAIVPAKGEGSISFIAQDMLVTNHLSLTFHDPVPGKIRSLALMADFTIGLGRGLAVNASLPYIASKYFGSKPHLMTDAEVLLHPNAEIVDDHQVHSAWQDVHMELMWNASRRGMFITPFLGFVSPSHDYEYLGHATVGRDLNEFQMGVSAARLLSPWLPGAFVQMRYSLAFQERVIDMSIRRSNFMAEGGYFFSPSFRVYGVAAAQVTHGGIDIHISPRADLTGLPYIHHDQIQRTNLVNLTAGTSFNLTPTIGFAASVTRTVWGINGHALARAITVSASYSFGSRLKKAMGSSATGEHEFCQQEDQLAKCTCLRK